MASDALVFFSRPDPIEPWRAALQPLLPDIAIRAPDEVEAGETVRYALVWNPPIGFFEAYPDLAFVTILGAGADALAGRGDLPDIPVARLSDPDMARMMAHYVLFATLRYARDMPDFEIAQRERRWHYVHPRELREITVGVLGLGELGGATALELARQGFDVRGWSRTPKTIAGIKTVTGADGLDHLLAASEILVLLLPLTPATRGLLDARRLASLPRGAKVINVSRGAIIDEPALIGALASGHLGGATLDVFAREPLPPDHPFWTLPHVLVTPHVASVAVPRSAAAQVADNIRRVRSGLAPSHRIDVGRGY